MIGRDFCRLHGGKAPQGKDSPSFKHGRYSRDVPARLAARMEQALADPKLLDMRSEVALLDTRIGEVVARLDTEVSSKLWNDVSKKYKMLRGAMTRGKAGVVDAGRYLEELGILIEEGSADSAAWAEIQSLIDQRRKVVDGERKHMLQAKQIITIEQGMTMIAAMIASVQQHVTDKKELQAIQTDFSRLVTADNG